MAQKKRTKFEREDHLRIISAMYLAGQLQRDIAEQLGITQQQVSYDLREIRQQWRETTTINMDEALNQELSRIDGLEVEYWDAWRASKKRSEKARQSVGEKQKILSATVERETQTGEPRFLLGVQWCIEQRCKLLGLEQAVKQDLTIRDSRDEPATSKYAALSRDEKLQLLELHEKAELGRGGDAPESP